MNKRGGKEALLLVLAIIFFVLAFVIAFSAIEKHLVPIPENTTNITIQPINPDGTFTLCSDGIDNDGDGFTDYPADASCASREDNDELNPRTSCQDGLDNDNDGWIDIIDLGCVNTQDGDEHLTGTTQCSDELDNDFDTLIDGHDPECSDPFGTNESHAQILLMNTTYQCNDGIDNDGDSLRDWPIDPSCTNENGTENQDPVRETTYAYTTFKPLTPGLTHIIPIYWIDHGENWWQGPETLLNVNEAKIATDAMPEGHRVMSSFWLYRTLTHNRSDFWLTPNIADNAKNASGALTPYRGIWSEYGVPHVRELFDSYFRNFSEIGGEVDVFILDDEAGYTNWELGTDASNITQREQWLAIQNDPRASSLSSILGFSDLTQILNFQQNPLYLSWNQYAEMMKVSQINQAVYNPIRSYYPRVKMANWNEFYQSQEYLIPDFNGHNTSQCNPGLYCNGGIVAGTHQMRDLYGELGHIANIRFDGVHPFDRTPFHAFLYTANVMRSSKLSSSIPIYPYISYKSYVPNNSPDFGLRQSDYYQEIILHAALAEPDEFLFWNQDQNQGGAQSEIDNQLFNKVVDEFDTIAGFENKNTLIDDLTDWNADYVLTGMQTGGRKVWRFTPSSTVVLTETNQSIVFQTATTRITFSQGKIWRPIDPVSVYGYWVVQAANAPAPLIENIT